MQRSYMFSVNGFLTEASFRDSTVENLFLPLLHRWTTIYKEKKRRIVVFLSAPPGTGKTTLSHFLEHLSKNRPDTEPLQAIGLDGFHYPAAYIRTHSVRVDGRDVPMQTVKGSPETFDLQKLTEKLQALRAGDPLWPVYDRVLHDVTEDAEPVTGNIVLLEGNWLLSTEGDWAGLLRFCDDSVFIAAAPDDVRERLVQRKAAGGLSRAEAERFVESSDLKNVVRLMQHHHSAHTELQLTPDGDYVQITNIG